VVKRRSSSTDSATLLAISLNASWLPGSIILDHVCHTNAHQQEHQESKQFTRRSSRTYISIIALRWGGGCAAHQIMLPCKCTSRYIAIVGLEAPRPTVVEYHFITRALVCRSATANNHLCEELRPTMHSDTTTGLSYRMVSYWRPTPHLANYHSQLRR
jgi:hypothetical protein